MKQGIIDARYERIHEPQILSLMVSVGLHGMVVMVIMAGTWLWGASTFFKPLPSYTVALVDAPLSLKHSIIAVKPEPQAQAPSPKVPAPKPSPPPKPVAEPAQAEPKPVKPKPAPVKPPPSKTVKPIAKAKKTPAQPKGKAGSPKQSKTATSKATPRAPAKPLAATSTEAESTLAKLRHRQAQQEADRQQAETVARQAAAQRLADLRQQVSQDDTVGRAAVQAVGLQQVRLAAYQERLRSEIIDAWVLPLPPEQSRELQATAFFRVSRDGRVEQLSLVQASGNTLFDASLIRAIKRASPLPHLPLDYPADVLEVEMRFQARES